MLGTMDVRTNKMHFNKMKQLLNYHCLVDWFYPTGQLKQDAVRDQQLRTEVDKAVFHFPAVVCHVTVTSGHSQVT